MKITICGIVSACAFVMVAVPAMAQGVAPGAPGRPEGWVGADKYGFGTVAGAASNVWFTLGRNGLNEIYYPRLDTPSVRDLQLVVSDGATFAEREADATNGYTVATDPRSLSFTQIEVAKSGRYGIIKTYATDSSATTVLVGVQFYSFTGVPYQVYALLNPGPNNDLTSTHATTSSGALLASNGPVATAFKADPAFTRTSNGYFGTNDGYTDLYAHNKLTATYATAEKGNVVQTGLTGLDGVQHTATTLAIGFGASTDAALQAANASLRVGLPAISARYAGGWDTYLRSVHPAPSWLTAHEQRLYNMSAMVLAASEDKTYRGAYIASPSMPWVNVYSNPTNVYHLVWARDLYQIATALFAIGDRAGATRARDFMFDHLQKPDGSFPQNAQVDGTPVFGSLQLDEVAFPIILDWQLRTFSSTNYRQHIKPAADFIVKNGPTSPQERWEEQNGYSPSTIAAEIAALVCAAELADRNFDGTSADRYLITADAWRRALTHWDVTTNGPLSPRPYFPRLTKNADPNTATQYNLGNSAPTVDQRTVADAGFLELVRLGITSPEDPVILNSLAVVDANIREVTPNGTFWHRYSFDGYGEQGDGSPWNYSFPLGSRVTFGRLWPLLSGERGEYEVLRHQYGVARTRLSDIDHAAKDTYLLSEQVWDHNPPSNDPNSGFVQGKPTTSATPLAWTHAQFLRLVVSLTLGRPVERPRVVACRYVDHCAN